MDQTVTTTTFTDLALNASLMQALEVEKYTHPTPIQAAAIPHLLAGRDLLGCAQTGTGKTAAFALPILQRLDELRRPAKPHAPRVLVLSPTRELAAQISESFAAYGRFIKFRQAVIFGGVGQAPQVRALSRGVHVVIATPGRLLDLMNQGHVQLDQLEVFVLDEADRMFDMGFLPDLNRIVARLPKKRQSLFFSATMPDEIARLANRLLTEPQRVSVTPQSSTVERIEQRVLLVGQGSKRSVLTQVLKKENPARALVFTRTKRNADRVAKQLSQAGYQAAAIHGNKSQNQRTRTLDQFRQGTLHVLVATDLAARGIDIDGISHVINYDLPDEPTSYVHRIGRTARAGATGVALSFCEPSERGLLRSIERLTKQEICVDDDYSQCFDEAAPAQDSVRPPRRGARPSSSRSSSGRPSSARPSSAKAARPAASSTSARVSTAAGMAGPARPRRRTYRTAL